MEEDLDEIATWVVHTLREDERAGKTPAEIEALEERLYGLNQGFHGNRLEGNPLTRAEYEKLRAWIVQGLSDVEIIALLNAEFKARYPVQY